MTGFLEESAGVRSMTRLCALLMVVGCLGIVAAIVWVALKRPDAQSVITALGVPLVPLAGGVWGALKERSGGES